MNDPKKHHFIPQFYLKGWCGNSGKLYECRKIHGRGIGKWKPVSSGQTCYEPFLYSLDNVPDHEKQDVEKLFMSESLDGPAAKILAKILDQGIPALSSEERWGFTRFIMSLRCRAPDCVDAMKKMASETIRNGLDECSEEFDALLDECSPETRSRIPKKPSDAAEMLLPGSMANSGMRWLQNSIDDPETGKIIETMHWWLMVVSTATRDLLTSDRPLVTDHPSWTLALPLNSRMIFFASKNREHVCNRLRQLSLSQIVRSLNESVVTQAHEKVFSENSGHEISFIEKRLGVNKRDYSILQERCMQ